MYSDRWRRVPVVRPRPYRQGWDEYPTEYPGVVSDRSERTADDSAPEAPAKSEEERWRDARRELEAAKARVEREGERAKDAARAELVAKLFPVLDGLDRSLASGSETGGLAEGMKLVRSQLAQVLADFGVERIDAVGQLFDPEQHEAVDVVLVDSPSEHNRVAEEWEAGYRYAGRVLRPARVRVARFRG